ESDTQVFAEDLASHDVHRVSVPLDDGCRLVPPVDVSSPSLDAIVTNGSLIGLTEFCPDMRTTRELAVDLSGRLVTEFDPASGNQIYSAVLSAQTIAFIAQHGEGTGTGADANATYLDDLGTGELVALGGQVPSFGFAPRVAGRYVLWYSGPAGHVGRLAVQ